MPSEHRLAQRAHRPTRLRPGHCERPGALAKALRKNHFATLATVSEKGRPHNAGVVYDFVDGALWIHTMQASRKGRNLAATPRVGVTIPFRKLPVGPPYTIHFQGRAELVSLDDPAALELVEAGRLDSIAGRDAGARSATAAEVLAAA